MAMGRPEFNAFKVGVRVSSLDLLLSQVNKQRIPLSSNDIITEALGKPLGLLAPSCSKGT